MQKFRKENAIHVHPKMVREPVGYSTVIAIISLFLILLMFLSETVLK